MMDAKTLEALKQSIAHWEEICAMDDDAIQEPPTGPENCALCGLFNTDAAWQAGKSCSGCPVFEAGYHGCGDSPYDAFEDAVSCGEDPATIRALGQKEVAFLRSLLPPDAA